MIAPNYLAAWLVVILGLTALALWWEHNNPPDDPTATAPA